MVWIHLLEVVLGFYELFFDAKQIRAVGAIHELPLRRLVLRKSYKN